MLLYMIMTIFSLEGFQRTAGIKVKRRFTIRRIIAAELPDVPYYEMSEQVVGEGLNGRYCFERCLADNKRKRGSCAFAKLDPYQWQFEHPAVRHAPFEQLVLHTQMKNCWFYPAAVPGDKLVETWASGILNERVGIEGSYLLAAFVVESESVPYPKEPWHPEYPDYFKIQDERMKNYFSQEPVSVKCNKYISWPLLSEPSPGDTTTTSTQPASDSSTMGLTTQSVSAVPLHTYICSKAINQRFDIRCGTNKTMLFDIMLAQLPIEGCHSIGIGGGGATLVVQTMNATQAKGWCVVEQGCGGAAEAVGVATRTFGTLTSTLLSYGEGIQFWCYALRVVTP